MTVTTAKQTGPAIYRIWPYLPDLTHWSYSQNVIHDADKWWILDFLLYVNLCTFCEFHVCYHSYWTAECLWFHSSVICVWVSMIMNSCIDLSGSTNSKRRHRRGSPFPGSAIPRVQHTLTLETLTLTLILGMAAPGNADPVPDVTFCGARVFYSWSPGIKWRPEKLGRRRLEDGRASGDKRWWRSKAETWVDSTSDNWF